MAEQMICGDLPSSPMICETFALSGTAATPGRSDQRVDPVFLFQEKGSSLSQR